MLSDEQDAMGHLLKDYLETGSSFEVIERDDGYINLSAGGELYFSTFEDWPEMSQQVIQYARGRVLDVGAGAGRMALYLQQQGHEVVAVDNSSLAIDVCKARGVHDARVLGITEVDENLGTFGSIVMMGNNFGLFANAEQARTLLHRFAKLTTGEARIIVESTNATATDNPTHLAYHERNRQQGRMPGQIRFRVRYLQYTGPWMDYLLASPEEMRQLVEGTAWSVTTILGNPNFRYAAVLEKSRE